MGDGLCRNVVLSPPRRWRRLPLPRLRVQLGQVVRPVLLHGSSSGQLHLPRRKAGEREEIEEYL